MMATVIPVLWLIRIAMATASVALVMPVVVILIMLRQNMLVNQTVIGKVTNQITFDRKESQLMKKIYKILGKRGRITIPCEIRKEMGFAYNDVVSFEMDGDTVVVKLEKICNSCIGIPSTKQRKNAPALIELLEHLTLEETHAALLQLSVRWANMQSGGIAHEQ